MKKSFIVLILGLMSSAMLAQENQISLKVTTSRDSILLGNSFEVTFTLENGSSKQLPVPSFKDFEILMGPSTMSSTSVVNGVVSSSSSISYVLRPIEVGQFFIAPISVEIDGEYLETFPVEINVYPNPEGIIQETQKKKDSSFEFFFSNPFDELREFDRPFSLPKEGTKKKPKKKRRTTRL